MNVTSAQYIAITGPDGVASNASIKATIDGEEVFVPINTGNKDYAYIKAKHDDANDSFTIQDAD